MEKYTSKTKRNECKNEGCKNPRQDGSSRCIKCARTKEEKLISRTMSILGKRSGAKKPLEHFKMMNQKSLETRRANKILKDNNK